MARFTADDIRAAHADIAPVFRDSPQYVHEGLTKRLGVPVVVKVDVAVNRRTGALTVRRRHDDDRSTTGRS